MKSSACANLQTPDVDFRSISSTDNVELWRCVLWRATAGLEWLVGMVDITQTEIYDKPVLRLITTKGKHCR